MQLKRKIVVITGGASGLGAATARYFVEHGAKVSLFDLNEEAGQSLCAELGAENAIFHNVDVTNDTQAKEAIEKTAAKFGTIHININAAGIPAPTKILDREGNACDLSKFAKVVNVNLIGLFNVMSKCVAVMVKNPTENDGERGGVINVSSARSGKLAIRHPRPVSLASIYPPRGNWVPTVSESMLSPRVCSGRP